MALKNNTEKTRSQTSIRYEKKLRERTHTIKVHNASRMHAECEQIVSKTQAKFKMHANHISAYCRPTEFA